MEQKQDICPCCAGKNTIVAKQSGHGAIYRAKNLFGMGKALYHIVCLDCGTVIRSYIKDPQDWA